MTRTLTALTLGLALVGCTRSPDRVRTEITEPLEPAQPLQERRSSAVKTGVGFLTKHQSPDGAWRSDVYATFKDGTALTPLVLCALQDVGDADTLGVRARAGAWLAKFARPDGTIDEGPDGIMYPVYTASLSVIALSHPEQKQYLTQRNAWLKYLLDRQLNVSLGWSNNDKPFGGWGYYPKFPKKPVFEQNVPAQHLLESNLSATRFAMQALAAVGAGSPGGLTQGGLPKELASRVEAAILPALQFVDRCQNDDGGFHFIYDDPIRNKAGVSNNTPEGQPRYHSYGSATADGLLARAAYQNQWTCGLGAVFAFSKPQQWLVSRFQPDRHPGEYIPTHERNRNAVYFYYCAGIAKLIPRLWEQPGLYRPQAERLSEAILAKQNADGSWQNEADQQRENDPVLATAYALSALAHCGQLLP